MAIPDYIIWNGKLCKGGNPMVEVSNRSFRYGDGLFESMRMFNGKIPLFDMHTDRLWLSLQQLEISPTELSPLKLWKQILLLSGKLQLQNARIRVSVFRSGGGYYKPESNDCNWLVEMEEMPNTSFDLNKKGLEIGIYTHDYKPRNLFASMKTCNALLYVLAAKYAYDNKLDDALLINRKGRIVEATSSNIIIVKGNSALTPTSEEGPVSGIMREVVTTVLNQMDIDCKPGRVILDNLVEADEVWLTNAISGIRWVGNFGKYPYKNQLAIKATEALNAFLKL